MKIEGINVTNYLDNFAAVQSALKQEDAEGALDIYLANYGEMTTKSPIEWELSALILHNKKLEKFPSAWPEDLLARTSGAILAFIASQVTGADISLPGGLAAPGSVPPGIKELAARALELKPNCAGLQDNKDFETLVSWLSRDDEAIAPCLLAAAARKDIDGSLIETLSRLWLTRGLVKGSTPGYLLKASQLPQLREVAGEAVSRCISLFWEDNPALMCLQESAFKLEHHDAVIAFSEILLNRDIETNNRQKVLARRLVALVETGRVKEAAEEYNALWQPTGWPFPYPDRLLYPLQKAGANEAERHLLETIVVNENTPLWVVLNHERMTKGSSAHLLTRWTDLYHQDRQDEAVLVGLTYALLDLPPIQRDKDLAAEIRHHWQILFKSEPHSQMAGAFLVLIEETHEECIKAFEKYLYDSPLSLYLTRQAALAYLRALGRRKRWEELLNYLDHADNQRLRSACPFEEYEFVHIMALLEGSIPGDEAALVPWCQHWERLISLPLQDELLRQVVHHFIRLKERLSGDLQYLLTHEFYIDVEYQVLRRAKAEAEKYLEQQSMTDSEKIQIRSRLGEASLEATHHILEDISI